MTALPRDTNPSALRWIEILNPHLGNGEEKTPGP